MVPFGNNNARLFLHGAAKPSPAIAPPEREYVSYMCIVLHLQSHRPGQIWDTGSVYTLPRGSDACDTIPRNLWGHRERTPASSNTRLVPHNTWS